MSELPSNWLQLNLGDECVSVKGKKPNNLSSNPESNFVPYVDIKAFEKGILTNYADPQDGVFADVTDTLMVWDGARSGLVGCGVEGVIGSTLVRIRPKYSNKRYLHYFLKSQFGFINSNTKGTGIPHVDPAKLWSIPYPLAPHNEQKRIADKLDSILVKVDRAQARLDKIPGILKRFRQSVLAAATSGELTREWRGNKDADWETTVFGDLIKSGPQNGIYKPSSSYGSGTKIIRIDGFYDGNLSPWSTIKRVQLEETELSKWKLNVDDILINRVNSIEYLGKCGHVDALPEDAVFESNIMRVELDKARAIPRFIKYFLSSPTGLSQLRANAKHAVNQASINQTDVKSVEIQLPSIEEQMIVVNKVEALFLKADYFEKQYSDAKKLINKLGQSILTKAFRGELVEQNDTEEPASQLLERIKQQQREVPKATRQTRKPAAKVIPSVDVVETDVEVTPPESEILALLKNTSGELSAQQIVEQLTEKTFEQIDALFSELKRLLDNNSIVKVGSGEACTFKAIKR